MTSKKMAINEKNGKPAVTHYKVLERFGDYTYMQFKLETGRTHQIRVHMASINHPCLEICCIRAIHLPKTGLKAWKDSACMPKL